MKNPKDLTELTKNEPKQITITQTSPRKSVHLTFPDGRVFAGPKGATIEAYIKAAYPDNNPPVMACLVNGQIRELTYHAYTDLEVAPITLDQSDGLRIYRRSLSLLLVAAADELFPEMRIFIDYGLNFGGFYFEIANRPSLTQTDLNRLKKRMQDLVEADLPIIKERVPLEETIQYFIQKKMA